MYSGAGFEHSATVRYQIYEGEFKNGEMDGYGRCIDNNGDNFTGHGQAKDGYYWPGHEFD